jgi:hypothetical protein
VSVEVAPFTFQAFQLHITVTLRCSNLTNASMQETALLQNRHKAQSTSHKTKALSMLTAFTILLQGKVPVADFRVLVSIIFYMCSGGLVFDSEHADQLSCVADFRVLMSIIFYLCSGGLIFDSEHADQLSCNVF